MWAIVEGKENRRGGAMAHREKAVTRFTLEKRSSSDRGGGKGVGRVVAGGMERAEV